MGRWKGDAYRSNCNVKLTAMHRLKPGIRIATRVASQLSCCSLQLASMRPNRCVDAFR